MRAPFERQPLIALSAVLVLLGQGIATALVIAAYGFDLTLVADHGALVARGLGTADLLRWGALIDMLGYLALAPVVLYVYSRHRAHDPGARLVALSGLSFTLVGAIGAVLLASAGAWLLQTPTTDAQTLAVARVAYGSLESLVVVGLWGTLELLLLAVWLIGSGWWERATNPMLGYVGVLAGVGAFGYAVRTGLTGQHPLPIAGPLDIAILAGIALLPVWLIWLAILALRDSSSD